MVQQAEAAADSSQRRGRTVLYGLFAFVGVVGVLLVSLAAITLYEIHSCVTPGWPCAERSAENTAEIVVSLSEGHVEIAGDLDDIKKMLREIQRMQGEN